MVHQVNRFKREQMTALMPVAIKVVEVRWHWTDEAAAVTTCDFHPSRQRLLTGGDDSTVRIWEMSTNATTVIVSARTAEETLAVCSYRCVLKHEDCIAGIQTARWSPCGSMVIVAYGDRRLTLWRQVSSDISSRCGQQDATENEHDFDKESWSVYRNFSLVEDVIDVVFSPDGAFVCAGCANGMMSVFKVEAGIAQYTIHNAHEIKVQGVAWDPLNVHLASLGADRKVRFWQARKLCKAKCGDPNDWSEDVKTNVVMKGEHSVSHHRRGSWSSDGFFLAVPCGWIRGEEEERRNCVFLYTRNNLKHPALYLSVKDAKTFLGARFAPCLFNGSQLDEEELQHMGAWGPKEACYVIAAWTSNEVYVFRSDSTLRYCSFKNLHYRPIRDVAWSHDGTFLAIASEDGYVSMAAFTSPLGTVLQLSESHPSLYARALSKLLTPLREAAQSLEDAAAKQVEVHAAPVVRKKKRPRSASPQQPIAEATAEDLAATLGDLDSY